VTRILETTNTYLPYHSQLEAKVDITAKLSGYVIEDVFKDQCFKSCSAV